MRQDNSKHDDRIMTCMLVEFFSREYAARKFLQDSMKGEFELCQWNDNYWSLVRYIVLNKLSCADILEFKGKTIKLIDLVHSSEIYSIHGECQKEISYFINLAILVHHNSLTANPKNKLPLPTDLCEYKQHVSDLLVSCRDEVIFLHSICVNYGYYPHDLMKWRGASELIKMFEAGIVPFVNPFVRTTPLCESSDVRINYATSDGISFFEDEIPGLFYFYADINEYKDIKMIIDSVRHVYSRICKKNKLQSKVIGTGIQTIQLCINMGKKNFNINDCIQNVQDALFSVVLSVKTFEIEDTDLLFDALWDALNGKNKRISYFKRIIGLYLWDSNVKLNKSINSTINDLMEAYNSATKKSSAEKFNNTDVLDLSRMYFKHFDDWRGKFAPDYCTLYKEYMLAKDCINSLNFLPHGHR